MGERHSFGRKGVCLKCGAKNTSTAGMGPCEPWQPPRRKPSPRPTVLTMDGETGSDGRGPCPSERIIEGTTYQCVLDDGHDPRHVFGEHRWGKLCDWESTCPAPTPRAG
jgi:hypothetical protein